MSGLTGNGLLRAASAVGERMLDLALSRQPEGGRLSMLTRLSATWRRARLYTELAVHLRKPDVVAPVCQKNVSETV